jgi:membrane fusion protein, multidrug efflux system
MKRRIINWSTIIVALVFLVGVIFYTRQLIAEQAVHRPLPQIGKIRLPEVSVLSVERASYSARVEGYGETKSHYTLTLNAQTNGQVIMQSPQLETGCQVKKGDLLLQMEDSDYLSAVAGARSDLATAKLTLLEEQREARQAQSEWDASGLSGEPDSDLVLHVPQLVADRAAVVMAEAALTSALKDLSRTKMVAPFDAIVIQRLTSPGSYLQVGTEVATLYSTDMVEIAVPLSTRDWENLPNTITLTENSWPVQIKSVEGKEAWSGRVLRAEQHVDLTSRQRTLLVAVDSPMQQTPPLLPGTFVEVDIEGSSIENVWKLPSSSLSQRGEIWYVTETGLLDRFATEPIFSKGNSIYISVPKELSKATAKVVVHPLSSYLQGMKVQPILEDENV